MNKTYRFIGEGPGIPGLPHELTMETAKALGLADVLEAAIARGTYQENRIQPKPFPGKSPGGPTAGTVGEESEA